MLLPDLLCIRKNTNYWLFAVRYGILQEEYRGKGIGKYLVEYFEKISDRDKFFLAVADFNPDAKRFYESIGYHQVGEIPGLYREGITEYIMMKEKQ